MDDNDEADPDWHCQLEENGGDAGEAEKESASVNIIRQVVGFLIGIGHYSTLLFVLEKLTS